MRLSPPAPNKWEQIYETRHTKYSVQGKWSDLFSQLMKLMLGCWTENKASTINTFTIGSRNSQKVKSYRSLSTTTKNDLIFGANEIGLGTDKPITKIYNNHLEIKLRLFTQDEPDVVLTKIKNRKAASLDEISLEVWKIRKFDDFLHAMYNKNTIDRWT